MRNPKLEKVKNMTEKNRVKKMKKVRKKNLVNLGYNRYIKIKINKSQNLRTFLKLL